jgi:hypothetical protein
VAGRRVGGMLLGAAILSACTPGEEPVQPASTAAVERTSGPLADGVEILDGSVLLGTVFEYSDGSGWWATLRVDGDPRQLMDAYREQFESLLGIPVRPDAATGCGPQLTRPPFELLCRSGAATSADWLGLRLLVSDDASYLQIERSDPPSPTPGPTGLPADLPSGEVAPATEELLAEAYSADHMVLRIVEGSRQIGVPLPNEAIGYQALLEVTGDPPAVMRGYAAQFRDGATTLRGDERSIVGTLEQAGGAHITIRAMLGEPSFIRVSYSYD